MVSTDSQSDYTAGSSKIKINLRQRGVGAQIGGIRVGTNWEEVLLGGPVAVTGVTLDQSTLLLAPAATATLVATVSPEDAEDPSVTWSSSNEAVATVADGVVTAVADGEATITVTTTDGSFTADCVVTVDATVGISDFNAKGFSLYPNPVSGGVLNLKLSDTNKATSIELYNMLGALVHTELVDNRSIVRINTNDLFSKGVYFVKVNNASGSHVEQFIVQ
ncbi:MAG: Ig-like domain-containing protein [Bacteroidales bacterium]|nr:Ig-like domain-containing protein [Bacteroidales bacterium]